MANETPVPWTNESRRRFLKQAATFAGSAPFVPAVGAATMVAVPLSAHAQGNADTGNAAGLGPGIQGYQSLGPDEAAFVETLVNVMCPADELTPGGVDCGLAVFIDRQLAGGYGKGERLYMRGPWVQGKPQHGYQLPLTPEQFFKVG
ncbi:gluconate 2-dehydrogenase subunit 3 family protein, partial [Gillisia sp. Q332]